MRVGTETGVGGYAVFIDDTKMAELIVFLILVASEMQVISLTLRVVVEELT